MPTTTYTYNLDGAMATAAGENPAAGESFSAIRRHAYTRLPVEIVGSGGNVALRYDSYGRRLHKTGLQTVLYRSGTHHPTADRTTTYEQGDEIHQPLVEHLNNDEIIYLFTPAGQTVTRRRSGHTRVERDHLRSVRAETYLPLATCHLPFAAAAAAAVVTAHYSTYGKAIITGGELRRAFAGYEPDAEVGLYNANRRLYAPTLRLFVSVDPRLQNASPYPYCADDPFNNVDPTGGISSAIVNGIVQGIIIIIATIITFATDGAGSLLFSAESLAEAGEGSEAGMEAIAESIVFTPLKGAAFAFGATAVSNGADLIVKAAYGEHITAWQAVKSMLIEPLIAGVAGAVAGEILAVGALVSGFAIVRSSAILSALSKMLAVGVSALVYSAISSVSTAALNNQLSSSSERDNIGIQMAIAFGEAVLLEGAYFYKGRVALNKAAGGELWKRPPRLIAPEEETPPPETEAPPEIPKRSAAPVTNPAQRSVRSIRKKAPLGGAGASDLTQGSGSQRRVHSALPPDTPSPAPPAEQRQLPPGWAYVPPGFPLPPY
jgi:RHS repeat-associated protein